MTTKQIRYQRRQVAKGMCRYCQRPLFRSSRCKIHYKRHREYQLGAARSRKKQKEASHG